MSHAREKFDVILMDILLPDTNGVDLCQRLRSWHHCPIIFTSCLDDTDTIAVSYTPLDVYKRQVVPRSELRATLIQLLQLHAGGRKTE